MTASALRTTTKLPAVAKNLLAQVMDLSWVWGLPGPLQRRLGNPRTTSPFK